MVYLDFGGRCKKERLLYCDLLLEKRIDVYLKKLDSKYNFFDIYWYYNLENICTVQDFIENRDDNILTHDQKYYDIEDESYSYTTIVERLEKYRTYVASNKTITETKFLIGKIFDKGEVVKLGPNIVGTIFGVFKDLQPIYTTLLEASN